MTLYTGGGGGEGDLILWGWEVVRVTLYSGGGGSGSDLMLWRWGW